MTAKILSSERYFFDAESELSPIDLALGWGNMSDESMLEQIQISQRHRFYYWYTKKLPMPKNEIIRSSANMHLIPANKDIEDKILDATPGEIISLKGELIYIKNEDGWRWKSSLTRNDSGKGACEVIWVTEFGDHDI